MAAPRARGGQNYAYAGNVANNKQAQLANSYEQLAKELKSEKLRVVGAYTLGRVIGEGTYGSVHLATHRPTGTRCAIKKIPKSFTPHLTREIHHHRQLQHPNIVHLHEIVATETNIWLVTELCSGGELFDYLVERGRILEGEARRLFGELTVAVGYMHRHGVVHRDLKLENVLLDGELRVKLGDLGFVREWQKGRLMETFCGTTGYASPEMLAGRKYLGIETDIWSLGVILYTMLCGGLPFDDDSEAVMKDLIQKGEYEEPEWLSDEAKDLIRNMLKQDPTQRLSIEAILSHPWFKRTLVDTLPTSTSNPHSPALPSPLANSNPFFADTFTQDNRKLHLSPPVMGISPGQSPLAGPSSFFPPQPPSDSSEPSLDLADSEHTRTDIGIVTPTTAEDDDVADIRRVHSGEFSQTEKDMEMLHSNMSQSTIRKSGQESPTAGSSVRTRLAARSGLAGQMEVEEEAVSEAEMSSGFVSGPEDHSLSVPVVAQHNRTPSRTKRRSVSSSLTLERRHSHHSTSGQFTSYAPEDYLAQLDKASPEPFSTPSEKALLRAISDIGYNTGQLLHSVTNNACDAPAANWWFLRNRQAERGETDEVVLARESAAARRKEKIAALEREDRERRERKRAENKREQGGGVPKNVGVTFKDETTSIPATSFPSTMELGVPLVTPSMGFPASPEESPDIARVNQAQYPNKLANPPRPSNPNSAAQSPAPIAQSSRPSDPGLNKLDTTTPAESPSRERPPSKGRSPSMSMLHRATSVLIGGGWKSEDRPMAADEDRGKDQGTEIKGEKDKRSVSPTKLTKPLPRPKMGMAKSESDPALLSIPGSARTSYGPSPSSTATILPNTEPEAGPSRSRSRSQEEETSDLAKAMLTSDGHLPKSTLKTRGSKRDSLWSTLRHIFNEDKRRGRRNEAGMPSPLLTSEVKVAPAMVLSRGIAARAPHVGRTSQPLALRRTSTDGRPNFSRRTSSANSRRSSLSGPEAHSSSQDGLHALGRRTSVRSHGSQTPTSERGEPSSRPSSVHELHIHPTSSSRRSSSASYMRSPSLNSDVSSRYRGMTPASPLHNYHRRAPAGSASTRVRHIRVIPEATIMRPSSHASSLRSNNSSRASSRERLPGDRDRDSDYDTGREDGSINSRGGGGGGPRRSRGSDDRLSSLAQQIHRKGSPLTLPSFYGHYGHASGSSHGSGHGNGHGHSHRRPSLVPKAPLRDVFQQKDDEWVSEDEEPTYSGGLGQSGVGGGSGGNGRRNTNSSESNANPHARASKWESKAATFPGSVAKPHPTQSRRPGASKASSGGNGNSSGASGRSRRGSGSDEESRSRSQKDDSSKDNSASTGLGISSGTGTAGAGSSSSASRRRGIPSARDQPGIIEEEEEEEE